MSCLSYTHVPYIPARVCSGPSNIRVTVNDISEVLDLTSRRPTSTRVYLTGTCTHKLNAHKLNTPSNFVCIVAVCLSVCLSVKGFFEDLTTDFWILFPFWLDNYYCRFGLGATGNKIELIFARARWSLIFDCTRSVVA